MTRKSRSSRLDDGADPGCQFFYLPEQSLGLLREVQGMGHDLHPSTVQTVYGSR